MDVQSELKRNIYEWRKIVIKQLILTTMLVLSAAAVSAGDVEDAAAAYGRGDYLTALTKYRSAATKGNAAAQYQVGLIYDRGDGVDQNFFEAARWYKLAAEQGDDKAQANLGRMYQYGRGVEQDYAKAMNLHKLAAEQGNVISQENLGNMYMYGEGVLFPNKVEAARWYKLAAAQGDSDAQNSLGIMYLDGVGVVQDYARAYMWINLSTVSGFPDYIKNRNLTAVRMTREQISEGQKMARECQARNFKNCD